MDNTNLGTIIQERLKALPEIIQKAIADIDFTQEMVKLQKKYALSLDKIADLEIETMIIMLDLDDPDNFIGNLEENLGIEKIVAKAIENDLNEAIFKKIRTAMVKEDEKKYENLNKESILEEIENPIPTSWQTKIKSEDKITPSVPTIKSIQSYTPNLPTKNIVEQKLSEPTHIPPKEIEISLEQKLQTTSQIPLVKKIPTIDPYKESIV